MIVGLSTFDSVLDRVSRENAEAPTPTARSRPDLSGLGSILLGAHGPTDRPDTDRIDAAYFDHDPAAAPTPPPKPEIDPTPFARLSVEEIAGELDFKPSDTPAQLHRKRRAFARLNHPDRTPEEWRDAATLRMTLANQLIDEALRKAASGHH